LIKLVRSLLDVSRIANNRLTLNLADTDLRVLVKAALDRFQPDLARARCSAVFRGDAPVVGKWDPSQIDQIVANLVSNAIKFGPKKPIEVSVGEENGMARLIVQDHGIGIDPLEQGRIFDLYQRAVSGRHYGGLGLGLYISRQIAQAHSGTIRVASEPGAGATFTLELPCVGPRA
jgi:signal transduction histidine kinase